MGDEGTIDEPPLTLTPARLLWESSGVDQSVKIRRYVRQHDVVFLFLT